MRSCKNKVDVLKVLADVRKEVLSLLELLVQKYKYRHVCCWDSCK
jgi:hypothetical protein